MSCIAFSSEDIKCFEPHQTSHTFTIFLGPGIILSPRISVAAYFVLTHEVSLDLSRSRRPFSMISWGYQTETNQIYATLYFGQTEMNPLISISKEKNAITFAHWCTLTTYRAFPIVKLENITTIFFWFIKYIRGSRNCNRYFMAIMRHDTGEVSFLQVWLPTAIYIKGIISAPILR